MIDVRETAEAALPATMRAAMLYDVDDIRIEERSLPRLEPGDVLLRSGASGVCSGDLMPWYVRRKAPFVFGHELAGTVVAVAPGGDGRFARGDRVFAHHHAPCLHCDACSRGAYVHCATWRATHFDPGGMAEFVRVPAANLTDVRHLPAGLPFADASLTEPLACVVKSLHRAFPVEVRRPLGLAGAADASGGAAEAVALAGAAEAVALAGAAETAGRAAAADVTAGLNGRTLLVIGAGVMGLMHVAVAVASGVTVVASDFDSRRLAVAEALGAQPVRPDTALAAVRERTAGRGADAVVCGPGTSAALAAAVEATAPDGRTVMFTPIAPEERFTFDQSTAYFRDVRLVASYSCGPDDTAEALALLGSRVVTAAKVAARSYPFPDVRAAYEAMRAATVVKSIVEFEK